MVEWNVHAVLYSIGGTAQHNTNSHYAYMRCAEHTHTFIHAYIHVVVCYGYATAARNAPEDDDATETNAKRKLLP